MSLSSLQRFESSLDSFRQELTDSAHVALVLSDAHARSRITRALEARGITVFAFENGALFWEWSADSGVAVGIFEVDSGGLGGLELMARVRERERFAELIALADQPDAELAVKCMEVGAHELFRLPLEKEELFLQRISVALERWRRAAIDQRISDQFHSFANSIFRKKDRAHRRAVHAFAEALLSYKRRLEEAVNVIYVAANAYAGERVRSFLESEGYRVHLFTSVEEAGTAAAELEGRLLLADAELADGTAFDAYARISTVSPDIEFLVISPANAVDIALQAMERGARDCILKPHEGLEAIQQKAARALRLQADHFKHERLVIELRRLCQELVRIDTEAEKADPVMIKVDPGGSQATLMRMLSELNREQQKRMRDNTRLKRASS